MRTFSRPLTEKRRLPRKPTYQASKQAASQGRCVLMALPQQGTSIVLEVVTEESVIACVNGLTPTGDGNVALHLPILHH